ncbi:MAG: TIGR03943 family protein [Oscillatoriaceae bacterium SKW80]|nr:TIGR03943 family protein [Oscillatoriaceae bacterium SKYG93]MCX8120048.1 TIGR03943 family protein [Oscillatoriaceae bacterium SKW80]MDW8454052.1 TIGR03943 family protein [Oscillatoriaceae cyanobacterium SKYGB_i_bin93]HIK29711.1 TIGR03943 family protein [Oscillatoriaceae cyanobacterium M7585_C2015_266]
MSGTQNKKIFFQIVFSPWLDVAALAAWGMMMLKYWLTGKLYLLIHPNYFWLVVMAGLAFLALSALKAKEIIRQNRQGVKITQLANNEHLSMFPPGFGSGLLLVTALLGLLITPQVFSSQTALERGVTDVIISPRLQRQSFRARTRPEERSLIDWVRTLSVYPEPETYRGQKVKVQGFVIHPPSLPEQYLIIARFIVTCCAADAYPVGLPVKLPQSRTAYPADTWLEIEGQMGVEVLADKRQLVIEASSLKPIPKPPNPYDY